MGWSCTRNSKGRHGGWMTYTVLSVDMLSPKISIIGKNQNPYG